MNEENPGSIRPHQIIFLEHQAVRLYAEAIDVVPARQLCWARPLMLIVCTSAAELEMLAVGEADIAQLYPLEEAPDLLWPLDFFQAALDLEVISLLSQAQSLSAADQQRRGLQQLHYLIKQIWQAHPELFVKSESASVSMPRIEKGLL